MQRIKYDDFQKGDEIPELKIGPIEHMDLVKYAGASGDFNPIHTDPVFAKDAGLDGTIAHGMYIMALIGRMQNNWVHPLQVKNFNVKFKGMTVPGDTVVCTGKVKRKNDDTKQITVAVQAANGDGEVKVAGDLVIAAD